MKTFTDDETGEKYELDSFTKQFDPTANVIAIKPVVVKEEKQPYVLSLKGIDAGDRRYIFHALVMTDAQEQALAEAIKALVEYCTADDNRFPYVLFTEQADKARKALMEQS